MAKNGFSALQYIRASHSDDFATTVANELKRDLSKIDFSEDLRKRIDDELEKAYTGALKDFKHQGAHYDKILLKDIINADGTQEEINKAIDEAFKGFNDSIQAFQKVIKDNHLQFVVDKIDLSDLYKLIDLQKELSNLEASKPKGKHWTGDLKIRKENLELEIANLLDKLNIDQEFEKFFIDFDKRLGKLPKDINERIKEIENKINDFNFNADPTKIKGYAKTWIANFAEYEHLAKEAGINVGENFVKTFNEIINHAEIGPVAKEMYDNFLKYKPQYLARTIGTSYVPDLETQVQASDRKENIKLIETETKIYKELTDTQKKYLEVKEKEVALNNAVAVMKSLHNTEINDGNVEQYREAFSWLQRYYDLAGDVNKDELKRHMRDSNVYDVFRKYENRDFGLGVYGLQASVDEVKTLVNISKAINQEIADAQNIITGASGDGSGKGDGLGIGLAAEEAKELLDTVKAIRDILDNPEKKSSLIPDSEEFKQLADTELNKEENILEKKVKLVPDITDFKTDAENLLGGSAENAIDLEKKVKLTPDLNKIDFETDANRLFDESGIELKQEIEIVPTLDGTFDSSSISEKLHLNNAISEQENLQAKYEETKNSVRTLVSEYIELDSQLQTQQFSTKSENQWIVNNEKLVGSIEDVKQALLNEIQVYKDLQKARRNGTNYTFDNGLISVSRQVKLSDIHSSRQYIAALRYEAERQGVYSDDFFNNTLNKEVGPTYKAYAHGMAEWIAESKEADLVNEQVQSSLDKITDSILELLSALGKVNLEGLARALSEVKIFADPNVNNLTESLMSQTGIKRQVEEDISKTDNAAGIPIAIAPELDPQVWIDQINDFIASIANDIKRLPLKPDDEDFRKEVQDILDELSKKTVDIKLKLIENNDSNDESDSNDRTQQEISSIRKIAHEVELLKKKFDEKTEAIKREETQMFNSSQREVEYVRKIITEVQLLYELLQSIPKLDIQQASENTIQDVKDNIKEQKKQRESKRPKVSDEEQQATRENLAKNAGRVNELYKEELKTLVTIAALQMKMDGDLSDEERLDIQTRINALKEKTVNLQQKYNDELAASYKKEKSIKDDLDSMGKLIDEYGSGENLDPTKLNFYSFDKNDRTNAIKFVESIDKQLAYARKQMQEFSNSVNTDVFKQVFDEASSKVQILKQDLLEGKIEAKDFRAKFDEIRDDLKSKSNAIALINTKDWEEQKRIMSEIMNTMSGGKVISQSWDAQAKTLTFTFENVNGELERVTLKANEAGTAIAQMANKGKTQVSKLDQFLGKLVERFYELIRYLMTFVGFHEVINTVQKGIEYVWQLDDAMTALRKVSSDTEAQLESFKAESYQIAKAIGVTGVEVVKSAAEWEKLGHNIEEASILAKNSNIYANVGDMDIESATTYMVSTLAGFEMVAEESMNIIDIFNKVGNEFSISSEGLGQALQKSAASFNLSNTDLESSVALITAANSVIQNPDRIGTMWKTVSARLRGATNELDSMSETIEESINTTSKLRKEILGLTGVDIMENETTFKNLREIIYELGYVYNKTLNDIQKQSLVELVAGKNHSNSLASALQNFELIQEVYEAALNSENSAIEENAVFMESITGRYQSLMSSWQELWAINGIDETVIKSVISLADAILQVANNIGLIPSVATTAAAAFGGFKFIKNLDQIYICTH